MRERLAENVSWSTFGPREDEKRQQTVRTSERRNPKGHKGVRRISKVGRPPDSDCGSAGGERPVGSAAPGRQLRCSERIAAALATTTRPHDTENCRKATRNDERWKPAVHKASRRISPILQAREIASSDLHTAEVTGSIPVAPTTSEARLCVALIVGAVCS